MDKKNKVETLGNRNFIEDSVRRLEEIESAKASKAKEKRIEDKFQMPQSRFDNKD